MKNKSPPREGSQFKEQQLPTLISPSPAPRTSGYKRYQDDAVTSKTPETSEGESSDNDEAMQGDTESDKREVVEITPTDQSPKTILTKQGKGEVVEITPTDLNPKEKSTLQKSKSLEINSSQASRALGTIKIFNSRKFKEKSKPLSSPKNVSKETEEVTRKGLPKQRGRPRKRANLAAVVNLDADKAKAVEKTLTRSREKAMNSQSQTNRVQTTSPRGSRPISNTQVGNGSGIIISKRSH